MNAFEVIFWCLLFHIICVLVYYAGQYNVFKKFTSYFASREKVRDNYDRMYSELFELLQDLRQWYSIDTVRSGTVTIRSKGAESEEMFKITADELTCQCGDISDHPIPDDAYIIICQIQAKLQEIESY